MFIKKYGSRFTDVKISNYKIETLLLKSRYFTSFVKSIQKKSGRERHKNYYGLYDLWENLKAKTNHREYEKMVSIVGKLESDSNV